MGLCQRRKTALRTLVVSFHSAHIVPTDTLFVRKISLFVQHKLWNAYVRIVMVTVQMVRCCKNNCFLTLSFNQNTKRRLSLKFYLHSTEEEVICFCPHAHVCLSVCVQDYSKTHACIWIKCCVSTDVGTWTNWLTFESDPNHSPDPGTRFTPDFWILAGYLNKLWTDFDEI